MKPKYFLPVISALFLIIGILTLSDYGINWDAPVRMMRGQAFAHLFLTGESSYKQPPRLSPYVITADEYATRYEFLDGEGGSPVKLPERVLIRSEFEAVQQRTGRISFYQSEVLDGEYFLKNPAGHPPLVDILSAFSNKFFYQFLGILGDIESYQLAYIFLSSIGVFIVTKFSFDITKSWLAAAVSGLSLALFPYFFAESHYNMKDPIQAVFYAGSIWSFWKWVKENQLRWGVVFAAFVIFALGVKWNIIFIPFILLPWLVLIRQSEYFKKWFKLRKIVGFALGGFLGGCIFLVLIWPALWSNPFGGLLNLVHYYIQVGIGSESIQPEGFILPFGINLYPLVLLGVRIPEIILLLSLTGLFAIFTKKYTDDLKTGFLIILWIFVPILRQMMPNVWFYSGIRQMLEVLPALAVLAGLGAYFIAKKFKKAQPALLFLVFLVLLVPIIRLHPNQTTYFNFLVGGIKGAHQRGFVDLFISYGNIYKQGVEWLNQNAEPNANLALLSGPMYAVSPLWLRSDISFSPYHFSGLEKKGEYIIVAYDRFGPNVFAYYYLIRFLKPIHTISIEGVDLLYIYKNDPKFVKKGFEKETRYTEFTVRPYQSEGSLIIDVDLGREREVTRMTVVNHSPECNKVNAQFSDEIIEFLKEEDLNSSGPNNAAQYFLKERKDLKDGALELSFPAEKARIIRIRPQSGYSCFLKGVIYSIRYLDN